MSLTCTLTIQTQTGSMATGIPPQTTTFARRFTRTQSSPIPPHQSPCSSTTSSPSASRLSISSSSSQTDKISESVSKLAALPSLSKSLNNLPSLAGQSAEDIPVYEGMPSRAQKSSREKLKMALGNSGSSKFAPEKNGFYSSPFFSMTPMSSSVGAKPSSAPLPRPRSTTPKQRTFQLHAEDEDSSFEDDA